MKTKKYKSVFFLLLITTILLSSCYSGRMVHFEILMPADFQAPDTAYTIAVANHTAKSDKARYFKFMDKVLKDTSHIDTLLPQAFITGLKSVLFDSPALMLNEDTINIPADKNAPPLKRLRKDHMLQFQDKPYADLLLVLESIDVQDEIDLFYTDYDLMGEMRVILHASLRLYDQRRDLVLMRKGISDTLYWYGNGYSRQDVLLQLPSRAIAYDDAAYAAGKKFAELLSPWWMDVQRVYYTSLKHEFQLAETAMEQNQWDEAAKIWKELAEKGSRNTAAKASFNMALIAERKGKLDIAKEWLEKSYELKPSEAARQYLLIIKQRIKLTKELDEQINRF